MTSSVPPASLPRVIACESTGRWSAGLRRELAEESIPVWECRSLGEAWAALKETPAALVVVEATRGNREDLLQRMAWRERDFPHARIVVVAGRALARCEWLFRAAGAIHFTTSPRELAPLARLITRHLASVPLPAQTMIERIWESLPWKLRGA
jgi:DNA-binding NtrC family response regulator